MTMNIQESDSVTKWDSQKSIDTGTLKNGWRNTSRTQLH